MNRLEPLPDWAVEGHLGDLRRMLAAIDAMIHRDYTRRVDSLHGGVVRIRAPLMQRRGDAPQAAA